MLLGCGILGGMLLNLLGVVLGIAALLQRERRKVLAIIGLIFNSLLLLGVGAIMVVGLKVG